MNVSANVLAVRGKAWLYRPDTRTRLAKALLRMYVSVRAKARIWCRRFLPQAGAALTCYKQWASFRMNHPQLTPWQVVCRQDAHQGARHSLVHLCLHIIMINTITDSAATTTRIGFGSQSGGVPPSLCPPRSLHGCCSPLAQRSAVMTLFVYRTTV